MGRLLFPINRTKIKGGALALDGVVLAHKSLIRFPRLFVSLRLLQRVDLALVDSDSMGGACDDIFGVLDPFLCSGGLFVFIFSEVRLGLNHRVALFVDFR